MARYVDIPAIMQVISGIYSRPDLIDDDRYHFYEQDFTEEFHKVIFGSIYNLYQLGTKEINSNVIIDYLEKKPKKLAIFEANKGIEYLEKIKEIGYTSAFEYYYKRMKKMTLLRMYSESAGVDVSFLYDINNIFDVKKKEQQDIWLDNTDISDIASEIDKKITLIRSKYVENEENDFIQAGDKMIELIKRLEETPEIGYPLYGDTITAITRGARLKKFYLRSAATGVGKTRAMIGDACFIACNEIYDTQIGAWKSNGTKEPTIFISTEQEEDEIQTMMLAFLSGVDEDHIINGTYAPGERDRVYYAAKVFSKSPLYIKKLPDFSLQDIENTIKFSIREWGIRYVFHDYLHTSMKILSEVSSKTGVKGLREDNILFMISIRLKDLCNEYGVFIMTATQLNADYTSAQVYDQNLLRGAKSIADWTKFFNFIYIFFKLDIGMMPKSNLRR